MISVVVPAHNEALVIGRCLSTLLEDARHDEFEVLVVCNGCTDETAPIAESFGSLVRVIRMETRSKVGALNLGDAAASSFPRFYVDADVQVRTEAIRRMSRALEGGTLLAVSPALSVDLSRSNRRVKAYYDIWTRLPAVQDELVGRGVYAMSEQGRARFRAFPEVIADDLYVRTLFKPSERRVIKDCVSVVDAPRTARDLVRRKSRVYIGNGQIRHLLKANERACWGWMTVVRTQPRLLTAAPTYLTISVTARIKAWRRLRRGDISVWDRDESTR